MKQRTLIKIKTSKKKIAEEAEQKKQGLKKQPCIILIGWRSICDPVGLCACPKDLLSKSTSVTVKERSKGTKAVAITVSFLSACSCVSGWVDGRMDKWMDWWMDGWKSIMTISTLFYWMLALLPISPLQPLDSKHEQASKSADAHHSHHNWFCETRHVIATFARSKETTHSWLCWTCTTQIPLFFFNRKKLFCQLCGQKKQPHCLLLCITFLLIKREQTLKQRWIQRGSGDQVTKGTAWKLHLLSVECLSLRGLLNTLAV